MSQITYAVQQVRIARAEMAREISSLPERESRDRVASLLLTPPPELKGASVEKVLSWTVGVGPRVCDRLLTRAQVFGDVRLGELTDVQVRALGDRLAREGRIV